MDWQGVTIHEISITGVGSPIHPYQGDVNAYRNLIRDGDWDVILFQTAAFPPLESLRNILRDRRAKLAQSPARNPGLIRICSSSEVPGTH